MLLQPNDHILFYGDSITDSGRREKSNNNSGLGVGYSALIAATLGEDSPIIVSNSPTQVLAETGAATWKNASRPTYWIATPRSCQF